MKNALVLLEYDLTEDTLSALLPMDQIKEDNETLATCGTAKVNADACDPLLESNTWKIHTRPSLKAMLSPVTINGQN